MHSNDDQERVYQNCKFHDPWGRGSCARSWPYKSFLVKMHYFIFIPSSLLWDMIQTNLVTKEGSTKIVNFMTLGVGFLVLRCHISENALFIEKNSSLLPGSDQTN